MASLAPKDVGLMKIREVSPDGAHALRVRDRTVALTGNLARV